jgi:hypothetical protein
MKSLMKSDCIMRLIQISVKMRAKEKLEFNRKEFDYYEHVRKSIYNLYPLRTNKQKTKDYFSKYLFADARYWKKINSSNGTHKTVRFHENKDEIDHVFAYRVRKEIQYAICDDKTFLYAYNIIERDHNPYDEDQKGKTVKLKPETYTSSVEIEEEIARYKEDYPKNNLGDYLLDERNFEFYSERFSDFMVDEEWWLFVFNKAYEIFDRLRILAYDPFKAHYLANNIYVGDKQMEETILDLLLILINNYTYDLTPVQLKKLKMLAINIRQHRDENFLVIDKKYLESIPSLNLCEVNWIKATRLFNHQLIAQWVTHPDFTHDQQLRILKMIEEKYLIERKRHPDLFCYDLTGCFSQLQQLLMNDDDAGDKPDPPDPLNPPTPTNKHLTMKQTIEEQNTVIEDLKIYIAQLSEIIRQKNEELRLLAEKHDAEIENMRMILNDHAEDYNHKGLTLAQMILVFYYLFNELGVSFVNTSKTQWVRFLEKVTGKHIQNIRAELNIDFDSKKTKKNLKIVADLFMELLPQISTKIEKDSK